MLSPTVTVEEFERSNLVGILDQVRGPTPYEVGNLIWKPYQLVYFYGKICFEF